MADDKQPTVDTLQAVAAITHLIEPVRIELARVRTDDLAKLPFHEKQLVLLLEGAIDQYDRATSNKPKLEAEEIVDIEGELDDGLTLDVTVRFRNFGGQLLGVLVRVELPKEHHKLALREPVTDMTRYLRVRPGAAERATWVHSALNHYNDGELVAAATPMAIKAWNQEHAKRQILRRN